VWNIGCGAGFETYSLACALKEKYPGKRVRIWANDNNLINISGAPTLAASGDMPDYYRPFLSPAGSVQQFNTEIKEMTLFEYHDILHSNHVPAMDMIVARDVLSFLKPEDQSRLLAEFGSVLRPKGILILGKNEQLQAAGWSAVQQGIITAHLKE
jgi:purine-binding chemotaxis protein CheW